MYPIAYTYEADIHCTACAAKRFGDPDSPENLDLEGNPIGAIFETDETDGPICCGDCMETIRD